jgi:hypothetical protein
MTEEHEQFEVDVRVNDLPALPAIYESRAPWNGVGRPRFVCHVPYDDLMECRDVPIKVRDLIWTPRHEASGLRFAKASSSYPPEVVPCRHAGQRDGLLSEEAATDRLVRGFARLDACNIPRDRYWRDKFLRLTVVTYGLSNGAPKSLVERVGEDALFLALLKVEVLTP